MLTADGLRVRYAFELHCDPGQEPNYLAVRWGHRDRFRLEEVSFSSCTDDPSIEPSPPAASFDTHEGVGTGRLQGDSSATITWRFTDAGEPGRNDFAEIVVVDADGNLVLEVSGHLDGGNHQAHEK